MATDAPVSAEQLQWLIANAPSRDIEKCLIELKALREAAADLLSQIEGRDGTSQLNTERIESLVGSPSSAKTEQT